MKISVVVTAYNHEIYIRQCLDSILQQVRNNFDLEVILGDDCSSDKTRQLMKEYCEKYPDIFVLLPPGANLGIPKNIKRCLGACSGDYIAFCEGDDYWVDSYKLQKLSEFLESHMDCSLCFNAVVLYYEKENKWTLHPEQFNLQKDILTTEDIIENNNICGFSSCMYRADAVKMIPEDIFDIPMADWVFNMACGRLGKIGFIKDWMSVYRIHSNGAWSGLSNLEKTNNLVLLSDVYNRYFSYEYQEQFRNFETKFIKNNKSMSFSQIIKKSCNLLARAFLHPRKTFIIIKQLITDM